ncbi:MAG: Mu transposase C-terminal domain-containing protein, partial [Campylobacter sp.]|nr:Mu transposase C-terminal domain-containing protein [Campylobacter sp.]
TKSQVSCERSEAEQNQRSGATKSQVSCERSEAEQNQRSGASAKHEAGFLQGYAAAEQINTHEMRDMTTQKQGDLAYKSQICKQSETKTSLLSEISVYSAKPAGVSLARGKMDTHKGAMGSSPTHSGKIKVMELENMQKIKAVNELRNYPRGFSKTLWGQNIAKKYGVSLKTLYAWAKKCDELEYGRGKNTIDSTSDADTIFGENGENIRGNFGINGESISANFGENSAVNDFGGSADINFRAIFKSSSFKICALEWAVGFMLTNPLVTKKRAYEELAKKAIKENWAIGSYKSFARLLDKKEIKAMLLRATAGDRGVRNEIAPFVKRDLNAYESMELVCGDQIVFDFNAVSPLGEVVNPNAYVWIDMGSGAVIGVDVVFGKYNSQSVGRSLKMALKFGVADAIYTDNGKPELSKYITSIREQLVGIEFRSFDELNPIMVHKKAKPGNSRAKPIENIFNHIQKWLRDEIIIARGGSSYHKQDRDKKELLKGYMKDKPLNYDEFINFFENAIRKWNEHYNSARKIVPINAFLEKLEARNIVKFDDTTLDFIFSVKKELRVRNSSVSFSVKNEKFTYSHPILSKYHKELVEIRIDESDYESVGVFDIDTKGLICKADLLPSLDPRDEIKIKANIERNEAVVKAVKEAFKYYKDFYKKYNAVSTYTATAYQAKIKTKNKEKAKNKILMSNEELTANLAG